MISKRTFGIGVVAGFIVLAALIVMLFRFHNGVMDIDFITLLVVLMGAFGEVVSWIYRNFVHRLTDEHRDKLEKIVGKILQVHQTVKSIASGDYSREEFDRVREEHVRDYKKYANLYHEHEYGGTYDEEGLMFNNHFKKSTGLFSELRGLRSSAYLYFGEDVLSIMEDLQDVIESLQSDISSINSIAGHIYGQSLEDKRKIRELKESIWSLSWEEVWGNDEDGETKKRLEKFKGIPGRIDKVLSKYALKK